MLRVEFVRCGVGGENMYFLDDDYEDDDDDALPCFSYQRQSSQSKVLCGTASENLPD